MKSKIIPTLLILFCLTIFGCTGDDDNDDIEDIPTYNQTGLCEDGSYDNEQALYLTDTMFKILGMLDRYIGSYAGGIYEELYPDRLADFYSSHEDMADYFERLIQQFRDETQFPFEYTREVEDSGEIIFTSEELSKLINSFIINLWDRTSTLDRNVFCDASEENMLSYIESAYMTTGSELSNLKENWIYVLSGFDRFVTMGLVLKALGCNNVVIYQDTKSQFSDYMVYFDPNELVEGRLGIERVLSPLEIMAEYPKVFGDMKLYQTIE